MTSFDKEQKFRHILKWSSLILKANNKHYRRNIFCSFYTYELEKYCKDKLTLSYLFLDHFHKHHTNLGKHGCPGAKWSGESESI